MELNFQKEILYFLHIPKTGGTTFKKILDSQFDIEQIFPSEKWYDMIDNNCWDFSKFHLIRGHYGFGIHNVITKTLVYITMLRDPISWTISWYNHLMTAVHNNNPRITKIFSGKEDLVDVLSDPITGIFFNNIQVRYLALDLNPISFIQYLVENKNCKTRFNLTPYSSIQNQSIKQTGIPELDLPISKLVNSLHGKILDDFLNFPSIESIQPDVCDEKLLTIAKNHLLKMPFFGILEQFHDSILMLNHTFGWKPLTDMPKENVGNYEKEDIPEEVLNKIKQITKVDSELYVFAKELFSKRLSALNIS